MNCRFCNNQLSTVFADLGHSPPSNSFLSREALSEAEQYYPLKVYVCDKCFLVQLDEFKKVEEIFSEEYVYFSSMSKSWLDHSKRYVDKMISEFGINQQSTVIEIASNDGYLLQFFSEKSIEVIGIEPTESTAKVSEEKGINTIKEFFNEDLAQRLVERNKKADLLLGNNVLAHVPDINGFVSGLKIALKETGIITMEFPHLLQLVQHKQFDTIYHEHFSYLSLTTVCDIYKEHGLEVFHVEELPTHGGSLRVFAKHLEDESKPVRNSVKSILQKELAAGIKDISFYQNFNVKIDEIRFSFLNFLLKAKREGEKVAGYGAAAKGNTLLNYCGVKSGLIEFVVDAAPSKQGKFLPGSHIPVVKEAKLREFKPDYIIIFPWNIKEEIMKQLEYAKDWGAKFIVAIPELSELN